MRLYIIFSVFDAAASLFSKFITTIYFLLDAFLKMQKRHRKHRIVVSHTSAGDPTHNCTHRHQPAYTHGAYSVLENFPFDKLRINGERFRRGAAAAVSFYFQSHAVSRAWMAAAGECKTIHVDDASFYIKWNFRPFFHLRV